MFRLISKQRTNLNQRRTADLQVLSASVSEDLTQKAQTTIDVVKVPSNINLNDVIAVYDNKGNFIYYGVISSIKDTKISVNQFQSLFNDLQLIVPQTSQYQKNYYNQKTISYITDLYLKSKEQGYQSIKNTMSSSLVPTFNGLIDLDVKNTFKGIEHIIVDNEQTHMPYPQEKATLNLETYLYDTFNTYNRIVKPYIVDLNGAIKLVLFYPNGDIALGDETWDYNQKVIFDTWERVSNVEITTKEEDTNTAVVYNSDGTTLRGAYTILNDGTIQQIANNTAIPNRLGTNKTKYIFDSNNVVLDLAKSQLPSLQYNHKITFNISFDGQYKFSDFRLGQPIKFYSSVDNKVYDTILTAWKYNIKENSDEIKNATFTLGKVRTSLTSKINKGLFK